MRRTGLAQDPRFQEHLTGTNHPEHPARLAAIADALAERGLTQACHAITPRMIDVETLGQVHEPEYVARVAEACRSGATHIDVPDSAICPKSFDVARLAVGTAIEAVDRVMDGTIDNAFCAVRPPGHHAERNLSMGFCLFNNIVLAAQHLRRHHRLERVLVVDWDVHHGNGTQHLLEDDPSVLVVSLHGHPGIVYPGTGFADERGTGPGEGFTINIPMMPPSSTAVWQRAFDEIVVPAADDFAPEFVLISAGFDAHRLDPLAALELDTEDFVWMTDRLLDVSERHCGGRLVSLLEGGYHLGALGESVATHVERLLG